MSKGWLTKLSREGFRWYLRRFPLRDGKGFFYRRFHGPLAPGDGRVAVRLARGMVMRLDLADPDQRKMYFYGDYDERREADLLTRILEPGEIFWDVGANIGFFTLLAAACMENTGRVVAFEPQEAAWEQLSDNLSLNPWTNVVVVRAAVTDREGEACLHAARGLADGRANLYRPGAGQTESCPVRTVTLDGWQAAQGPAGPDFIKLDVEGAELPALEGGRETLTRFAPLLLVEMKEAIFQSLGTERRVIQDLLGGLGYRPAGQERGRWRLCREVGEVAGRNVLWLNPDLPRHRHKAARASIRGLI
jgi:FkbM family methyltransferase